jgi:hypothetical protein
MGQVALGAVKGLTFGGLGVWFLLDDLIIFASCLKCRDSMHTLGLYAQFDNNDRGAAFGLAAVFIFIYAYSLWVLTTMKPYGPDGMFPKLWQTQKADLTPSQKKLGQVMEGKIVTAIVIMLIILDLCSTVVNSICEDTGDLINPKYNSEKECWGDATHVFCVIVLFVFLLEQFLHIVAFGQAYFSKKECVLDLFMVCVSLLFETVLDDLATGISLLIVFRLWKIVAFVHDMGFAEEESHNLGSQRRVVKLPSPTSPFGKLSSHPDLSSSPDRSAWRQTLGKVLEGPVVSGIVVVLILVDLVSTIVNHVCEHTDWVNPKYDEQKESWATSTHILCVTILLIFLLEQVLHLISFGAKFFSKIWFVLDLVVVIISLLCETVLEGLVSGWAPLLIILRLWKVFAFIFDMLLLSKDATGIKLVRRDQNLGRNNANNVYNKGVTELKDKERGQNLGRSIYNKKETENLHNKGGTEWIDDTNIDQEILIGKGSSENNLHNSPKVNKQQGSPEVNKQQGGSSSSQSRICP